MALLGAWDEPGEFDGWFRFEGDGRECYGKLTQDPEEGPLLHLFDCPAGDLLQNQALPSDRLFVRTLGGSQHTITGFIPTGWSTVGLNNGSSIDGFAESVLAGVCLESSEELVLPVMTTRMHGLDEFLTGGKVDGGWLLPRAAKDPDRRTESFRVVELPDGAKVQFFSEITNRISRGEETQRASTGIQVDATKPRPMSELEETYLEPLRELVVFGTRRQAAVRSLAFHGNEPGEVVPVTRRMWPRISPAREIPYRLALNFREVSAPETVIREWFNLRESVGSVWPLFFATIGSPGQYLENRFLDLMAFCEGYHRAIHDDPPLTDSEMDAAVSDAKKNLTSGPAKSLIVSRLKYANSQSQFDRLHELAGWAGEILDLWDFDPKSASRAMVDTRNWMTHWGSKSPKADSSPESLIHFCRQLTVICYVTIMDDLGIQHEEIGKNIANGWSLDSLP